MDAFVVRGEESPKGTAAKRKPVCKYGAGCYRKNADHRRDYAHANDVEDIPKDEKEPPVKKAKVESPQNPHNIEEDPESESETSSKAHESNGAQPEEDSGDDDNTSEKSLVIPFFSSSAERASFVAASFLFPLDEAAGAVWTLAQRLAPTEPLSAFAAAGLTLCGPFDLLAGRLDGKSLDPAQLLAHCRFPLDPPELQTFVFGDALHYGLLRDDASAAPIVCSNTNAAEGFAKLTPVADNLLAALEMVVGKASVADPNNAALKELLASVEAAGRAAGLNLSASLGRTQRRRKDLTAPTLHGSGIRVPVKDDVGYRPLPDSNADLKKMLTGIAGCKDPDHQKAKMDKLDEIITYVQFANDECDYGMGLELGVDLWCSGFKIFESRAKDLLSVAYLLLRRPQHARIFEAHLHYRRKFLGDVTEALFK